MQAQGKKNVGDLVSGFCSVIKEQLQIHVPPTARVIFYREGARRQIKTQQPAPLQSKQTNKEPQQLSKDK